MALDDFAGGFAGPRLGGASRAVRTPTLRLGNGTEIENPDAEALADTLYAMAGRPNLWAQLIRPDNLSLMLTTDARGRFRLERSPAPPEACLAKPVSDERLELLAQALEGFLAAAPTWDDALFWGPHEPDAPTLAAQEYARALEAGFQGDPEAFLRHQYRWGRLFRWGVALATGVYGVMLGRMLLSSGPRPRAEDWLMVWLVGGAVLLAGWALARLSHRCPACGRPLGWGFDGTCTHCGATLR